MWPVGHLRLANRGIHGPTHPKEDRGIIADGAAHPPRRGTVARGYAGVVSDGPDHYFSAQPAAQAHRRTLEVDLRGQRVTLTTAPGVFSADHLDHATRILLDAVPDPPPAGNLLDLGCGWGPIALALALASPEAEVFGVDVNERALDLTRRNAGALGLDRVRTLRPEEVAEDVRFDVIWCNPAIRIGKTALHTMLTHWLTRLTPTGAAYLVVSKNLGADSLARWLTTQLGCEVERLTSSRGFRVLRVGPATDPAAGQRT